ncbi:MAG: L-threonylcarbamoyladenylate synthase [Rikenellaceae bacterium]
MSITNMDAAIKDVVEILRKGGIVLYPTDTVWGIGCDATNAEAVDKIYALKRSEDKKSMLVLCKDVDSVVRYVNKAPSVAFDVMEMSEKPLTAILPGAVNVATNLIPDEGTLGIRVPNHDFCHEVLRRFGKPIVSTSANISGEATPFKFVEISKEIIDGVDYVVDPRFEGKPTRKPSSIISFGADGAVKIIRE